MFLPFTSWSTKGIFLSSFSDHNYVRILTPDFSCISYALFHLFHRTDIISWRGCAKNIRNAQLFSVLIMHSLKSNISSTSFFFKNPEFLNFVTFIKAIPCFLRDTFRTHLVSNLTEAGYIITLLILINCDSEPPGYAENSDNWILL